MIKCMILDFDGLVLDTETSEVKSFMELYSQYQVEFPLEKWLEGIGSNTGFDPYEYLLSSSPELIREELRTERARLYASLIKDETTRAGVQAYLIRAKELDLKIALASSSTKSWIDRHMEQLGIRQYFDFICTADDVENVKPEPDLYLKVLAHFRIRATEAIVFEDSPNGALAAIRAGIKCVAVPNPTTASMEFDPGIALRLNSKEEMTLDEVLAKI